MGCSKNLVDSESLMRQFEAAGYHCAHDPKRPQGEIAVINTCGFIEDAKQESIDTILEFAKAKEEGRLKKLFVMGCLSQRYRKELEEEIPQVDKYYGKFDYKNLIKDLGSNITPSCEGRRVLTTPRHYAYLKISEGCDRRCAYCAIPIITGKHVSRPESEILDEVRELVASGVKEIQVIAQELTYYGVDIDGKRHIAELIDHMADIKGVEWIRLHYAYPNQFPLELLDVIASRPNVCKYLCSTSPTTCSPACTATYPSKRPWTSSPRSVAACRASTSAPRCSWASPARPRPTLRSWCRLCAGHASSAWAPLPIRKRRAPTAPSTMKTTFPPR